MVRGGKWGWWQWALDPNGLYLVVINGQLQSLGGRLMGADFNATFDTAGSR